MESVGLAGQLPVLPGHFAAGVDRPLHPSWRRAARRRSGGGEPAGGWAAGGGRTAPRPTTGLELDHLAGGAAISCARAFPRRGGGGAGRGGGNGGRGRRRARIPSPRLMTNRLPARRPCRRSGCQRLVGSLGPLVAYVGPSRAASRESPSTSAARSPTSACSTRRADGRGRRRFRRRRPDRRRARRRREAGVDLNEVALLARHDRRHERADHPPLPARGDGDDAGLPRRDRDPPRHEGRPLGRLQGRRAAVHPPPRPARGQRAGRLRGDVLEPLDEDEARAVAGVPAAPRASRPSPSASSTRTPTRRTSGG